MSQREHRHDVAPDQGDAAVVVVARGDAQERELGVLDLKVERFGPQRVPPVVLCTYEPKARIERTRERGQRPRRRRMGVATR